MKIFYRKFLALFLFVGFAFHAMATNDTLTVRKAYDWQIGDTLIYRLYSETVFVYPIITYGALTGFTVLGRTNYSDSLVYQVKYFNPDTISTLSIRYLDSPVISFPIYDPTSPTIWRYSYSCDSLDFSCQPSSCIDLVNSFLCTHLDGSSTSAYWSVTYKEKIGLWDGGYLGDGFQAPPFGMGVVLVYYSSGSFSWIDSSHYSYNNISEPMSSSPSFSLSPNPASDEITISTEAQNGAALDAYIYDITGNCVATHKNISANLLNIKVISLPPGYYFLKVTDEHANSAVKSFIVAR